MCPLEINQGKRIYETLTQTSKVLKIIIIIIIIIIIRKENQEHGIMVVHLRTIPPFLIM